MFTEEGNKRKSILFAFFEGLKIKKKKKIESEKKNVDSNPFELQLLNILM